jgi:hypothetical protein
MPALGDIPLRPAEAADQELAEPVFRPLEVVFRVHHPEDVVLGHLRIEGPDQPLEAVFADYAV